MASVKATCCSTEQGQCLYVDVCGEMVPLLIDATSTCNYIGLHFLLDNFGVARLDKVMYHTPVREICEGVNLKIDVIGCVQVLVRGAEGLFYIPFKVAVNPKATTVCPAWLRLCKSSVNTRKELMTLRIMDMSQGKPNLYIHLINKSS